MYRSFAGSWLSGVLLLSVALASACSSGTAGGGPAGAEQNSGGSNGSGGSGDSGDASGGEVASAKTNVPLGSACVDDQNCQAGLRCLASLFSGGGRYCTSPCAAPKDCDGLGATSYAINVPLMANAQFGNPFVNQWNATVLSRAVACAPIGGKQGEPSYCQFACPAMAAATLDAKGVPNACACLPGYKVSADKMGCEKRPSMPGQCTAFSYGSNAYRDSLTTNYGIEIDEPVCDACNSDLSDTDTLQCHTGRFMCELTGPSFNGHCIETVTVDELFACTNSALYQSCSCNCPTPDACNSDNCACCTCTQTSTPTPRPVCTNNEGVGGTGNGGSNAGGTSGIAGGTTAGGGGSLGGATGTAGHGSGSAGGPVGSAGTGSSGGATGSAGSSSGTAGRSGGTGASGGAAAGGRSGGGGTGTAGAH